MTNLDEQMTEIEQFGETTRLFLPYVINENGVVQDSALQRITTRFTSETQDAYLVACANAAPDLCAEIRRLREEVRAARLAVSLIDRRPLTEQEIAHAATLVDEKGRLKP